MADTYYVAQTSKDSTHSDTGQASTSTRPSNVREDGKIILILAWIYNRVYRFGRLLKRHKKVLYKVAVVVLLVGVVSSAFLLGKNQGVKQQKQASAVALASAQLPGGQNTTIRVSLIGTVSNLSATNLELKSSDNKKSTVSLAKTTITLDSKGKRLDVAKLTKNSKVFVTASIKSDGSMTAQRIRQE